MLVPEFYENRLGTIPDEFYESLPLYCFEDGCNFPMEMSETLTQLHCSNPRCPSKIVQRLVAMANQLGVKDLGEARAAKFVHTFEVGNPLIIFAYEPEVDGAMGEGISVETSQKIVDQFLAKKSFTLAEYVRAANLPFIQTSAMTIFGSYDDIEEAYRDIEQGGVEFIREKLNIKKSAEDGDTESVSVRALKIFESLMTFKDDLISSVQYVNIIKTNVVGMTKLKAVCSDEVGSGFKTKADFYATVNNMFPNIHVEFLNSITKDIDFLVWAGADGSPARITNKYKKVTAYNEKYEANKKAGNLKLGEHYIPIVTAGQFIDALKNM